MEKSKIQIEVETALYSDNRIWSDETKTELNKPKLLDLLNKTDTEIISLLLKNAETKRHFFTEIGGAWVFKTQDFRFFLDKHSVNNSYTRYANRIGLTDGERFLRDGSDIVLDFPFKDCVLNGGQSSEEGEDVYFKRNKDAQHSTAQHNYTPNQLQNAKKSFLIKYLPLMKLTVCLIKKPWQTSLATLKTAHNPFQAA